MRALLPLLLLLLVLLLGAGLVRAGDEDADEEAEPLHPDDVALVKRVGPLLPPKGGIDGFQQALGTEAYEVRDLGFGAAWRRFELFAETVTLRIDVVTHQDRIAGVRIRSLGSSTAWNQGVRTSWGAAVEIEEDGIEWRHEEEQVREAWTQSLRKALGQPPSADVGKPEKAAVALLTDPLSELTFGDVCYEDGSPPLGREAVARLLLAGSTDALDQVLRGPNPEGRVYAAEALLLYRAEGEALSADRKTALEKVIALDIPIRCCGGCLVTDEPASELLSEDLIRSRIACRILRRMHTGAEWTDVEDIRVYWDGTYTRRLEDGGPGSGADRHWRRGSLPASIRNPLLAAVRKGTGFLVQLGTPIYVHHVDDTKTQPPEGVQALLDHLAPPTPEGDLPPR